MVAVFLLRYFECLVRPTMLARRDRRGQDPRADQRPQHDPLALDVGEHDRQDRDGDERQGDARAIKRLRFHFYFLVLMWYIYGGKKHDRHGIKMALF